MPVLPVALPISIDSTLLEQFCSRWRIVRLELFGSVLRDDFRPESDVDLLVTFAPDARWGLFAHVKMQDELSALYDEIDLVEIWENEWAAFPKRDNYLVDTVN
jgi:predicted nucleotidyltransferase